MTHRHVSGRLGVGFERVGVAGGGVFTWSRFAQDVERTVEQQRSDGVSFPQTSTVRRVPASDEAASRSHEHLPCKLKLNHGTRAASRPRRQAARSWVALAFLLVAVVVPRFLLANPISEQSLLQEIVTRSSTCMPRCQWRCRLVTLHRAITTSSGRLVTVATLLPRRGCCCCSRCAFRSTRPRCCRGRVRRRLFGSWRFHMKLSRLARPRARPAAVPAHWRGAFITRSPAASWRAPRRPGGGTVDMLLV